MGINYQLVWLIDMTTEKVLKAQLVVLVTAFKREEEKREESFCHLKLITTLFDVILNLTVFVPTTIDE